MARFFPFFVFLGTKRSKQPPREKRRILENTRKGDKLEIPSKKKMISLQVSIDSAVTVISKLCDADVSLFSYFHLSC